MTETEETLLYRQRLASRFLTARASVHLSQVEVAEATGTTQNIVFRLENDLRVGIEGLLRVALFYMETKHINPEWLFAFDNSGVPMTRQEQRAARAKLVLLDSFLHQVNAVAQ